MKYKTVKDKTQLLVIYSNGNNIIQSGETLRLWAFLTDVNGNALSNQEVVFYTVKNTVKTQIGSPVTTNTNGIAICDYVGSGMGDIAIMAETEIEGMIQSETYEIWDTLFFDNGTDTSKNSEWYVNAGSGTKEITDNGMKLSNSNSTRYDIFIKQTGQSSIYYWNAPLCMEVDITEISGSPRLQMYSSTGTGGASNTGFNGAGSVGHWKFTYDGTTLTAQKDNGTEYTYTRDMPNARIGFYVAQNEYITYKNFKIYSI